MEHILTSEAVTRGHPDKICDQIADAVLDAVLAEEPEARVACETAVWKDGLCIFGELSARQEPDYETIAREVLRKIGYDRPELGFDWETCSVQVHMHPQSPDIARSVRHRAAEDTGAGDQGILFGYACRETEDLMPLPITLANRLARRLEAVGRDGTLPWLRPDGKTQVSVAYRDGKPVRITTVVLSAQHAPDIAVEDLRETLRQKVILPTLPAELVDENTLLYKSNGTVCHRRPRRRQRPDRPEAAGGHLWQCGPAWRRLHLRKRSYENGPHRGISGPVSG